MHAQKFVFALMNKLTQNVVHFLFSLIMFTCTHARQSHAHTELLYVHAHLRQRNLNLILIYNYQIRQCTTCCVHMACMHSFIAFIAVILLHIQHGNSRWCRLQAYSPHLVLIFFLIHHQYFISHQFPVNFYVLHDAHACMLCASYAANFIHKIYCM